ncbi:16109_t:CDS:2, partial [Funneliformis geosporum]
ICNLISFMVTIFTKTLLHGIVFCFMNFLLMASYAMFVYNSCVHLPNIDGSSLTMELFQRSRQHKKYSDQKNVQKISMSSCINPCKLHNGISMGILIVSYCPIHTIRMMGKDFCDDPFKLYNSSESQIVSATGALAFFITLAQ